VKIERKVEEDRFCVNSIWFEQLERHFVTP